MCHPTDSRPPAAPGAAGVASHRPLTLTASDGSELLAHEALPAAPKGAGVVIIPDVRGLHPYYVDLVQRFAEAGYASVAVDYYGRTAGLGSRDDLEYGPHWEAIKADDTVALDVTAGVSHLRTLTDGPVFTVGFCWGGGESWRMSAAVPGLAGAIGFYGIPAVAQPVVHDMGAPLLLLLAGDDRATSPEGFAAFETSLAEAGVPFASTTYDGAPHSFFDRSSADWADACADAWRRVVSFIEFHGSAVPA